MDVPPNERVRPMKRVTTIESILKMKFEDINGRYQNGHLTTEEAAEFLGFSQRTFLRKRRRYEENGFDGHFDRRLGRKSGQRAADSEIELITKLYREKYKGYNVRHFYSIACRHHQFERSYSWLKSTLINAHLITKSTRGGKHRLRRERRCMTGMMLHQDGSTHRWIVLLDHNIDLIVTMDDATSEITSAFFVEQEGTKSSLQGIKETIEKYGLFNSFYTDRGTHYFYTPEAGGKVDKSQPTQVGKVLKKLGIQHIESYCPQGRGRSERMFRTLQGRLPQELESAGIRTIEEANTYLKETYLPAHNKEFMVCAQAEQSAYVPWIGGDLNEIICLEEERVVQNDNTISYKNQRIQIPETENRHHYAKCNVTIKQYLDDSLGVFYGPRPLLKLPGHIIFCDNYIPEKRPCAA
jgi:Helix-turn-helix domain